MNQWIQCKQQTVCLPSTLHQSLAWFKENVQYKQHKDPESWLHTAVLTYACLQSVKPVTWFLLGDYIEKLSK